ncbi:MAG: type II and III secretion system protein family protein [Bdellovibrionales bacterium]|jgi:pilus assembly protein CpaC|nr:type II and III secretion system protein family protein [Bdellovibrionales bacterium]
MKRFSYKMLLIPLGLVLCLGLSAMAEGATKMTRTVTLTMGKADTIDLGQPVADVLVANPAVADVGTLRSNRLYIVGKEIGDTNILAFDNEGNQLADIAVRVRVDEKTLRDAVKDLFPSEKVQVSTIRQDIVLRGEVSTPAVANQVRDLASRFASASDRPIVDLMSVRGEQQVMLRVKVLEAKRAVLREYGIDTQFNLNKGAANGGLGSSGAGLVTAPFATGSLIMNPMGGLGPFNFDIAAMERDGLVNTLAEPNLTAISGETAGFLAGGEFPVPVGRDQDGNVTLEFKQFGVALNFTPTVMSNERIALQLSTEVSAKSAEDGITLVGMTVPGLTVRRAETTVQMGSGGTLMIAGLIKSDTLDSINGLPGAKNVPVLGELFKSKSFARNESELVILVTPFIVKPYAEPEAFMDMPVQRDVRLDMLQTAPPVVPKLGGEARATPVSAPAQAARPQPVADRALSQRFRHNLHTVYGNRVPAKIGNGGAYGYIVD